MEKCKSNRIVFFSRSLDVGGMEKALLSLLNALAQRKYDITLYLENRSGALLGRLDKSIRVKGYRMCTIKNPLIRKPVNFIHRLFWTAKNYHKFDFSCCYATYSVICGKLALIASENSSLYVHSDYLGYYQGNKSLTESFLNSIFISEYKNVFFVSNESFEHAADIFPQLKYKFSVINNIIDPDEVLEYSREDVSDAFDCSRVNILYVGRLDDSSKDFELMLASFNAAHKQNPDLRLYLIGDGPDKQFIEGYIEKNNISQVFLLGEKENPYPYIKMCDAMLLTSKYEGYPIVYSEALILKKPFITTVPVSDDSIDIRKYFLIVDKKVDSISKAILQVNSHNTDYNINFKSINNNRLLKIEERINNRNF